MDGHGNIGIVPKYVDEEYTPFNSIPFIILIFFGLGIFTGLSLMLHYKPDINLAFNSIEFIRRDVFGGHFTHSLHAYIADIIVFLAYSYVGFGLYYQTYAFSSRFSQSVVILALIFLVHFSGFVLPWDQMAFWGTTVITNLFSAIPVFGEDLTTLIWGGVQCRRTNTLALLLSACHCTFLCGVFVSALSLPAFSSCSSKRHPNASVSALWVLKRFFSI